VRYLLVCLLMLGGCSSQNVVDAGAGRHSVTATSTHGVLAARDGAVKQANRYCARSGLQAVVQSFDDQRLGGVVGDPTSSVVFTCGVPNTTALSR
jgi:rhamnogalacturonyl hydrolase YesR